MKYIVRLVGVTLILAGIIVAVVLAQDTSDDNVELATGEIFILQGQVLDVNGDPVVGAAVEIWQTDANATYNHPQDADADELDPNFQYFGTAITGEDGYYAFRTIKPSAYSSRPPHIHVKVKLDDAELLTTQFYFVESAAALGDAADYLVLLPEMVEDEDGEMVRVASLDLVVVTPDSGDRGDLSPTPGQQEGPYYPVVDFSTADNDLTSTAEDDETVLPILPGSDDSAGDAAAALSGRALYRINAENSEVSFTLEEDLRGVRTTVIGTTDQVAGDIIIDYGTPMFSQVGTIRINARTLATDNEFRNRALRAEILLSSQDQYEFIDFAPTAFNNVPDSLALGETYTFDIVGDLTITGVTNEVTFTTEVTLDSESQISGTATTTVLYADWGITIPDVPGVANITEDVVLTITFVADQVEQ